MRDILIVEDHPFVAEATRALLEKSSAVREVVTVGTADAAVAVIASDISRWRLILLDLDIPGAVGLSLVRQIKDLGLAPITCVLTGIDRKDYVAQVRRQGFLGYVLKAARTSQLDEALSSIFLCKPTFPEPRERLPTQSLSELGFDVFRKAGERSIRGICGWRRHGGNLCIAMGTSLEFHQPSQGKGIPKISCSRWSRGSGERQQPANALRPPNAPPSPAN